MQVDTNVDSCNVFVYARVQKHLNIMRFAGQAKKGKNNLFPINHISLL